MKQTEARKRAARLRYWKRRIEDERDKVEAEHEPALLLAWRFIAPKKYEEPEDWRPWLRVAEEKHPVMLAIWNLLADSTAQMDVMLHDHYEPAINDALNQSIPLYERFRKKRKRRKA